MTVVELKNNFHKLIDEIEDGSVLSKFYGILKETTTRENSALWNKLSVDEQNELLKIDDDINQGEGVIPHTKIVEKHAKWLGK